MPKLLSGLCRSRFNVNDKKFLKWIFVPPSDRPRENCLHSNDAGRSASRGPLAVKRRKKPVPSLEGGCERAALSFETSGQRSADAVRACAGRAASLGLVRRLGSCFGFRLRVTITRRRSEVLSFSESISKSTYGSECHPELFNSDRARLRTTHEAKELLTRAGVIADYAEQAAGGQRGSKCSDAA
jgi:hypothetical protein